MVDKNRTELDQSDGQVFVATEGRAFGLAVAPFVLLSLVAKNSDLKISKSQNSQSIRMDKFAQLKILESRLESALLPESVSTIRIGNILNTIRTERLFCLSRPQTLKQYCKSQFNLEKSSVYNYITAWRVSQSLTIAPRHKRLVSVSALAKIATYPAQERQCIWDQFVQLEKPSVSNLLKLCSTNQV